ncbi:hypothetical protein E2K93_04240 [Thalassotalea sp. HSM 43]|uniref:hypothetical protein n=1 Tax=Thalassotalea sp. HSM 43 TaxID=2552945 RepID=UPI001080E2EC|nr:hypothetical protein [Thalassotalea sp. HSM 43]QBY03637.1 hypothetical protein E2K93_04240 [Thalassotalea sp. HSM 43]
MNDKTELEQLLSKPMPSLKADDFVDNLVNRYQQMQQYRVKVLTISLVLALLSLLLFLPMQGLATTLTEINQSISFTPLAALNLNQADLWSLIPVFVLALTFLFIKDDFA